MEKVYSSCGFTMRVKQVFDPADLGQIDDSAFYFIQVPVDPLFILDGNDVATQKSPPLSEILPCAIRLEIADWFFIRTSGRTWDQFMASLKASHAKKLRRCIRKRNKYNYTVTFEVPRRFPLKKIQLCYKLLCETMDHNSDSNYYSEESFEAFMRSLPTVLIASDADGRVLGFYSGDVIGHDHSVAFRSWGVYHNLFIEHVRQAFENGDAVIDLGNTNDSFKQELGGSGRTVSFDLRTGESLHGAVCLAAWAFASMIPEEFGHAVARGEWILLFRWGSGMLIEGVTACKRRPLASCGILALIPLMWILRPFLKGHFLDVMILCFGLCQIMKFRPKGA